MNNKSVLCITATLLCLFFTAHSGAEWNVGGGEQEEALSLEPNIQDGKKTFSLCSSCHLDEGWGVKSGVFPQLAGQHRGVLIKQLVDIRALNRDNPTMYPFSLAESMGGTQSIADVVAYIETLPMNPDHGKGPLDDAASLAKGKKLYEENCIACHGEFGEGNEEKFYPRIGGQHYHYMLRQLRWIRDGKRRNANPDMVQQTKTFTEDDMINVINYVSYIEVDAKLLAPSTDWKNPDFN